MAVYDSAKTRSISRQMNRLSGSMDADVLPGLRAAKELRYRFHGRTAQAMEQELDRLTRSARGLGDEIGALAAMLNRYADMLEEADEQLAREL